MGYGLILCKGNEISLITMDVLKLNKLNDHALKLKKSEPNGSLFKYLLQLTVNYFFNTIPVVGGTVIVPDAVFKREVPAILPLVIIFHFPAGSVNSAG